MGMPAKPRSCMPVACVQRNASSAPGVPNHPTTCSLLLIAVAKPTPLIAPRSCMPVVFVHKNARLGAPRFRSVPTTSPLELIPASTAFLLKIFMLYVCPVAAGMMENINTPNARALQRFTRSRAIIVTPFPLGSARLHGCCARMIPRTEQNQGTDNCPSMRAVGQQDHHATAVVEERAWLAAFVPWGAFLYAIFPWCRPSFHSP